jgi:hypothetical protein
MQSLFIPLSFLTVNKSVLPVTLQLEAKNSGNNVNPCPMDQQIVNIDNHGQLPPQPPKILGVSSSYRRGDKNTASSNCPKAHESAPPG